MLRKPSFLELETGVWKRMSSSSRSVLSTIYIFWHWEFSELHSSNRCHKFCVSNNEWSYVNGSLIRIKLLPNFWQMGIDLEGKTGSCCLWEFYFHLLPRPQRTKSRVKALSGPARADALTEMLIQSWKKAYTHRGPERFTGLHAQSHLVSWVQPYGVQLPCGASSPVWVLETRRASFESCSTTHCVPQVNFTIRAAISLSFKERDGLPVHMLVCFLTGLRTKPGDLCRMSSFALTLPPVLFQFSPEPFPTSYWVLRETESNTPTRPFIALQCHPIHRR